MGLELLLENFSPREATIEVYTNGLAQMYSGMAGNPNAPPAWMYDPKIDSGFVNGSFIHRQLEGYHVGSSFQTTLPQYFQFEPAKLLSSERLTIHYPTHTIYDLPESGVQLHLHGPDPDTITHGRLYDYERRPLKDLNGYEASMASLRADTLGLIKKHIFGE